MKAVLSSRPTRIPALALLARPWLADRPKGQPIFPVDRWAILEALKADLKVAGIADENDEGFADFHALRHTDITALAKSNAPVKIVQTLARHSTPVLTLGVHAHVGLNDQAPALDALPDLTRTAPTREPSALAATGTDESHKQTRALFCIQNEHGPVRPGSAQDVITVSDVQKTMGVSHLKNGGPGGYIRSCPVPDAEGSASVAGARPGLQNR